MNPVKEGDDELKGKGDRPNEDIIVTLPGGTEIPTKTDKNGEWTVKIPADKPIKEGDKIDVRDGDGNKTDTVIVGKKQISSSDRKGCTETLVGFGVPLLLLIPLGIASQVAIPGLQDFQNQVGRQIQEANTALQRQLGVHNPGLSKAAADFDARLKSAGVNVSHVLAGLATLAYGIAAITTIAVKCGPNNTEVVAPKAEGENLSSSRQKESKTAEEQGSSSTGSSVRGEDTAKDASSEAPADVADEVVVEGEGAAGQQ